MVYDGVIPMVSEVAAIPGGSSLPPSVTSTTSLISVMFVTDGSGEGTGFTLTIDFHGKHDSVDEAVYCS